MDKVVLNKIAQCLFDKKGSNILALDIRGLSTLTDLFLICEGNVPQHVSSLAKALKELLAKEGMHAMHIEGVEAGDWVVMDYGGFIVHLFLPELRERYALEELYSEAEIVPLTIQTEKVSGSWEKSA